MSTEIKLVQKPVIQHALVEVGKSVTARIEELNLENLVATDETIQSLKKLRADLNKEATDFETQRKAIKSAVTQPYDEFEGVYKVEVIEKYKAAVELLKDKIAAFEDRIKKEKKENVIRYFNELCAVENIDFLKFENLSLEINLSTSEKAYKDKCNDFVKRVQDDVILINTMDFAAEMMAEYKKNGFNASLAIKTVKDRKEDEKLEADRLKRQETNKRESSLRALALVYKDLTKSFHFVSDENIFITQADIENLPKEDFQKQYVDIESKVNAFRQAAQQQQSLFNQQSETTSTQQPSAPVSAPAPAPTPKPLQAPVETKPAEPEKQFSAVFEVTATMPQLTALANYMKSNGLTYKNL